METTIEAALKLMRWALAMLDQEERHVAALRLQHAIETVEAEGPRG